MQCVIPISLNIASSHLLNIMLGEAQMQLYYLYMRQCPFLQSLVNRKSTTKIVSKILINMYVVEVTVEIIGS